MERAGLSEVLRTWRSPRSRAQGEGPVVLTKADPRKFMTAVADALAGNSDIFLCDPKWGASERAQVEALLGRSRAAPSSTTGYLMIPTGGTGGQVRFARHDAATLAAAVGGFTRHFGLSRVNAVGLLPLHHVSGLMAWMRCALTGGGYLPMDWKAVEDGALPRLPEKEDGWVISLVPTQLERLLNRDAAVAWLRSFRIIFVGGGPAWPELLAKSAALDLPLSPGYGMTETAAMVAALRPPEFLAGRRGCGALLPHAFVQIKGDGAVAVGGGSLFRGYYPHWRAGDIFETEDNGRLDEDGNLHIAGRRDAVIISGGEKIDPAEVEAVLRGTGEFSDVVVVGLPDADWGQVVVAAYPEAVRPRLELVGEQMRRKLAPAKRPKNFVGLASWPVNDEGKINRPAVARLAGERLAAGPG